MSLYRRKPAYFKIYYMATGFGLQKDAAIIRTVLNQLGFDCEIIQLLVRKKRHPAPVRFVFEVLRKFNFLFLYRWLANFFPKSGCVALHLETIAYEKLFLNEKHILIPNQEWFDTSTLDLLQFMDAVWCKTRLAQNIFSELGLPAEYIGFRSEVNEAELIDNKTRDYFFSRTGMSQFRGAENLINVWRKHPEWPLLKIVIHPSRRPGDCPVNVEYIDVVSDLAEYKRLSGAAQFHIYMTEAEGFGHSIVEAMGQGSIVLVTDAPPMNEMAHPNCALLVDSRYCGHKMLSPRYAALPEAIEAAVERAIKMRDDEIALISKNAKLQYEYLSKEFVANMARVVSSLS